MNHDISHAIFNSTSDIAANRSLIKCYGRSGCAGAQAACLIRDTMKVTRIPGQSATPIAALFWIDPAHPEADHPGHTLRACRHQGIPLSSKTPRKSG